MPQPRDIIPAGRQPPDRDQETARLLRQGDGEGLRRMLMDHGGSVLGVLRKEFHGVLDVHEIEDAMSSASLRVWRASHRCDLARGSLGAWLYSITRNCAFRLIEKKRGRRTLALIDDLDARAAAESPKKPDRTPAFTADVYHCIDELSPMQRAVLLADLAAGGTAPADSLAEDLHTTPNVVYVSRNNGRKALRKALLALGHDLGSPQTQQGKS